MGLLLSITRSLFSADAIRPACQPVSPFFLWHVTSTNKIICKWKLTFLFIIHETEQAFLFPSISSFRYPEKKRSKKWSIGQESTGSSGLPHNRLHKEIVVTVCEKKVYCFYRLLNGEWIEWFRNAQVITVFFLLGPLINNIQYNRGVWCYIRYTDTLRTYVHA